METNKPKQPHRKKPRKPIHLQQRIPNRAQIRYIGVIHDEIAAGKYPNAISLGKKLRVHPDIIRRCKRIMEIDLEIDYDPQKKGWYFKEPVANSRGLKVTRTELIAALFLLQDTEHLQGTCWEAAIESLCEKISEGFPDLVTFHPSDWSKIMSTRSNGKTIVTPENLELLVNAINDRETLHVRNYNQEGKVSHRDVDAYHLQRFEDNLYLVAYDHKNRKELTFGAWRLDQITRTGQTFEKNPNFDPNTFFSGSLGIYADKDAKLRDIILGFSKRVAVMICERHWNGKTKVETLPDGTVNLHLSLRGLLEVSRLILRWGPDVVDIVEDELLEMHGRNLQQMNENYALMLQKQAERKKAKAEAEAKASAEIASKVVSDGTTVSSTVSAAHVNPSRNQQIISPLNSNSSGNQPNPPVS